MNNHSKIFRRTISIILGVAGLLIIWSVATQVSFTRAQTNSKVYMPIILYVKAPQVNKIYATSDTTVLQGSPNLNVGNTYDMWTGFDHCLPAKITRSLIHFDTSAIPSNVPISQVKLNLYLEASCDLANRRHEIEAYRIVDNWSAATATWNNQPDFQERHGSVSIPSRTWGWYSLDVTNLVRGWVDGSLPNNGLMVRGPESSGNSSAMLAFYTVNAPGRNFDPHLSILYDGATHTGEAHSVEAPATSLKCELMIKNTLELFPAISNAEGFQFMEQTLCNSD